MKHPSEFWLVLLTSIKNLLKGPLELQEKDYFNAFYDIQWFWIRSCFVLCYLPTMIPFLQTGSYRVTRSNAVIHYSKSCCCSNSDADIFLTFVCLLIINLTSCWIFKLWKSYCKYKSKWQSQCFFYEFEGSGMRELWTVQDKLLLVLMETRRYSYSHEIYSLQGGGNLLLNFHRTPQESDQVILNDSKISDCDYSYLFFESEVNRLI